MSSLQLRVLGLIAWLLFFFSIERVQIGGFTGVNLATSVYIIGMVAVLLPLIPQAMRVTPLTMVALIGLLYTISLLIGNRPIFENGYIYLTLAGAFFLLVTLLLSYSVGLAIEEFRRAVETVTLSDQTVRLRSLHEAHQIADLEMARSRRSERPISVMLFQANAKSLNMTMHKMVQDLQRAMMQRYVLASTANVVSRHLRRTDIIFEDGAPGRLVLLAPETGESEASRISARIAGIIHEQLGIEMRSSVAAFPQQALTFEDLLRVAEQRLPSNPHDDERGLPAEATPPQGLEIEVEGETVRA
jgi:hypothetical protein